MDKKRRLLILTIFVAAIILGVTSVVTSFIKRLPFTSNGTNLVITIEKRPCLGKCPIYDLTIYGSGLVVYDGELFVETKGKRIKYIGGQELDHILAEFTNANFFSLDDSYAVTSKDLPATIIKIEIDGRVKRIWHYGSGCGTKYDVAPPELCELEKQLDEILAVKNWVEGNK